MDIIENPATEWMICALMIAGETSVNWHTPFRVMTHWNDGKAIFETLGYFDNFATALRFPLDEAEIECELIQNMSGREYFVFLAPVPQVIDNNFNW